MTINTNIIIKNLNTFTNAYGFEPKSKRLFDSIKNGTIHVEKIGVLLRNPRTKQGLISCQFPLDKDVTNQMLWTVINEKELEAVPVIETAKASNETRREPGWKKYDDKDDKEFLKVWEGDFTMQVHQSFTKQGVIKNFDPKKGQGFIQRTRQYILFKEEWCNFGRIKIGDMVSFLPVISKKGLQARAIEAVNEYTKIEQH